MTRVSLLCALTLAAPAAIAADCPTRGDLASGVILTRDDPAFVAIHQATPEGLRETALRGDGTETAATYVHPLAVATSRRPDGTLLSLDYSADLAALDEIETLGHFETDVVLSFDGVPAREGRVRWEFVSAGNTVIDACRYRTVEVEETIWFDGTIAAHQARRFAPDLGLVVMVTSLDADGNPTSNVVFDRIEAAPVE